MPLVRLGEKIVFFAHIPKTGGASIDRYLAQKGPVALWTPGTNGWSNCAPQHMQADVYTKMIPRGFYDIGFTILRDPVARIVSEYRYRRDRRTAAGKPFASFEDWISAKLAAARETPYVLDNHLRPQTEFLAPGFHVFRFEDGMARIFDWIDGLGGAKARRRPWTNRAEGAPLSPSDDVIDLIRSHYVLDYELLDKLPTADPITGFVTLPDDWVPPT